MSLYESFKEVYEKETALTPCSNRNLYSTIHLSENDHTQILWDIIRYRKNGKYVFIKSFIKDCLGIDNFEMSDENVVSVTNATQYPSLSNVGESPQNTNRYGFIDLLLKDKDKVIIVENKVCDASDGKNQLARYFYTFAKIDQDLEELKKAGINTTDNSQPIADNKIFVVYLTKDVSKTFPTEKSSLPDFLKKRLGLVNEKKEPLDTNNQDINIPNASHYIHISYSENIVNWIKENVLPEISAYNSNVFYQSVALYVDYLENDLLGQTQKSRDIYITEVYNKIVKDYSSQKSWYKVWLDLYEDFNNKTLKNEDLQVLNAYNTFLRAQLNRILDDHLDDEWKAYCTPSFVLLYKEEWRKLSPNTDIPVLNLFVSPSGIMNLLNKESYTYKSSFNIERVKSDYQSWKESLKDELGEHVKTNRDQIYRFKNTYSIKRDKEKFNVECCDEVKQIINNVPQQTK